MGGMKDTIGDTPYALTYPQHPGFKTGGTSQEAARSMLPNARTLCAASLREIKAAPRGLTADQVAEILQQSDHAIRPRITELSKHGLIENSGRFGINKSRRRAIIWIVTEKGRLV